MTLSLKAKITIVFIFLFILLVLVALPFHRMQESKANENVINDYERLMHHIKRERLDRESVAKYLKNLNFTQVENPKHIFDNLDKLIIRRGGFETFMVEDRYYLHILAPHFRILFKDESNKFERSFIDVYIFLFVGLLFIFIYYLIIKNINDTQHQLKSRQLFLRTVMHELKTPIAKGRIVSELIDDEKQKNRIITIFEKLNFLIDDFAKVEQIVSNNYELNMYPCGIDTIVQKSIEMLMLDKEDDISLENISTNKIKVDLDLFSLALKNLIDNGLKYSTDTKIVIRQESNRLLFISNAKVLNKPLEEYFKPFHNDTKLKNHGMGLGLYITHSIVQMHGMKLDYEHKGNQNIFKVVFNSL
ncbi:two-component sensor histidine kinase [Sulfurimonas gotlandica GD1]|uniref:histidine kinase n=1 Tax=Sulfurimonas gotlandica (strain DSM 19862 / JCM 16533 / GD1) TaxID=929558 RepID=B6BNK6_SULGG|nr:ArsS family sensor histidine kinase [Sulfurimonas gotlandica]EDZ61444.1 two-component sensor [Sulfurimonas gotlandica GD1]EHP31079.1 two-component sensor histidine kinase [Sulfurimonas gotlandica GD1]